MLSLLLLFFAILLAVITALAGRVWCGYFCFQTVWTDVFTWIEEKIEGQPPQRRKLDKAPWDLNKIGKRGLKYGIWLLIGLGELGGRTVLTPDHEIAPSAQFPPRDALPSGVSRI